MALFLFSLRNDVWSLLDNINGSQYNMCNSFGIPKSYAHMNPKPDYDRLYETAEGQAGYFTAKQARKHGFSWERLSDNVKRGRFLRIFRGIYRLSHFPSSTHEDLTDC